MIMSPYFESKLLNSEDMVIPRKGVASSVIIPKNLFSSLLLEPSIQDHKIVFSEGDSLYVLTEEFGVVVNTPKVECNLFFVEGGLFLELVSGQIILKDKDGVPYLLDEFGDIEYPRSNTNIVYTTAANLRDKAALVIGHRYGIPKADEMSYVDNLFLSAEFYCTSDRAYPCLSVRFITQFEDLGCDSFVFVNFNEVKNFTAEYEREYSSDDFTPSPDEDESLDDEFDMDFEDEE